MDSECPRNERKRRIVHQSDDHEQEVNIYSNAANTCSLLIACWLATTFCYKHESTLFMAPSTLIQIFALLTFNYARNAVKLVVCLNLNTSKSAAERVREKFLVLSAAFHPLNTCCLFTIIFTPFLSYCIPILNDLDRTYSFPIHSMNATMTKSSYKHSAMNGKNDCSILQEACPFEILFYIFYLSCTLFFAIHGYWQRMVRTEQQRIVRLLKEQQEEPTNEEIEDEICTRLAEFPPASLILKFMSQPILMLNFLDRFFHV